MRVVELPWGDEDAAASLLTDFPAGFPLVVGSDCMYKTSTLDALFETVDALLQHAAAPASFPPVFLHAYQPRWEEVTSHLLTVARRYHFTLFIAVEATDLPTTAREAVTLHGIRLWRVETAAQLLDLRRQSIHLFVRNSDVHRK